jgi:hypothetical protein
MYEALHQRTVTIEIITEENKYSLRYQHTTLDGVVVLFYLCCDNGSPDGRDVQAGLIDRMV